MNYKAITEVSSNEDFEYFRTVIREVTGISLSAAKKYLFLSRVEARIHELGFHSLEEYRRYVEPLPKGNAEWQTLINLITTNKTEFFREFESFRYLIDTFLPAWQKKKRSRLNVWSAGCSTGEEAYTTAMVLEKHLPVEFQYRILATDVNSAALRIASNGVYRRSDTDVVPSSIRNSGLIFGSGEISAWAKIHPNLKLKINFLRHNLLALPYLWDEPFDVILCRNVFIYLESPLIKKIVEGFSQVAERDSVLITGQSESLQGIHGKWNFVQPAIYTIGNFTQKERPLTGVVSQAKAIRDAVVTPADSDELFLEIQKPGAPPKIKKRVLIVDDSRTIRNILARILSADPELEVVGTAPDPLVAEEMIDRLHPDVLTLDIHMPRMDGVSFLKKLLPTHPIPVVMISSIGYDEGHQVLRALSLGAIDFIHKPDLQGLTSASEMIREKVRAAAAVKLGGGDGLLQLRSHARAEGTPHIRTPLDLSKVLVFGASTGGTEALREILIQLPARIPPILIVQHFPPHFSRAFADRLNELCPFKVKEAAHGDRVEPGKCLIAPGGRHMTLATRGNDVFIQLSDEAPRNRHRPSVDFLFEAVAETFGARTVSVILTGMGNDGAEGIRKIRQAGGRTIAQDEASSVVFGMPKEAIGTGAVEQIAALSEIPSLLIQFLSAPPRES